MHNDIEENLFFHNKVNCNDWERKMREERENSSKKGEVLLQFAPKAWVLLEITTRETKVG